MKNGVRRSFVNSLQPARGSMAGALFMLAAAFMFGVLDGLIKLIGPSYRIWDIGFYRWGLGLVLIIMIVGRRARALKTHNLKLMIGRCITGCIAFLSLTAAIRDVPLSTAMVLFFSFPAFAALFSHLIFNESISKKEWFCICGALGGVAVLMGPRLDGDLFGYIMGLLSGVFAGLTVNLIKKLREKDGSVAIYFYFCLLGSLVCFPAYIANPRLPEAGVEWLMVGGMAASSVMAQLLMNQGFRYCRSWEGGIFLTGELIFTSGLGIVFLGEQASSRFWVGGFMILASTVLLNIIKVQKKSPILPDQLQTASPGPGSVFKKRGS
jgi:drug/metabolite transporter (DMT)-like permease